MPDAVLVDGYNVLHAIPRFAPRGGDLSAARERFESWLSQAAAQAGARQCVLVWDGRDRQKQRRAGPVTARAGSTWVVSSDHDVKAPARQLGFTVLGAMTFYQRWTSRARPDAFLKADRGLR